LLKNITISANFPLVLVYFYGHISCIKGLDKPWFCMYNAQTLYLDMMV
jgi:hypothetical protein